MERGAGRNSQRRRTESRGGGQAQAHPERDGENLQKDTSNINGGPQGGARGDGVAGELGRQQGRPGGGRSLRRGSGPGLVPVLRHLQDAAQGEPACLQALDPPACHTGSPTQAPKARLLPAWPRGAA